MKLPFGGKHKNGPNKEAGSSAVESQSLIPGATVSFHGSSVPLDYLVQRHDPKKYPAKTISTPAQQKQTRKDIAFSRSREQWFAAAAASIHVASFAYQLAFWNDDGVPPDRYWPSDTLLKYGMKPGRFGNLEGAKRIWFDNLAASEGL